MLKAKPKAVMANVHALARRNAESEQAGHQFYIDRDQVRNSGTLAIGRTASLRTDPACGCSCCHQSGKHRGPLYALNPRPETLNPKP